MSPQLFTTNPIVLPHNSDIRRHPPRKLEDQQPDYYSKFDFNTIFSDVFKTDSKLIAIGPPFLNLLPTLKSASFFLNSAPVPKEAIEFHELNRCSRLEIDLDKLSFSVVPERFTIRSPHFNLSCTVGSSHLDVFGDKNVLVTLSRDNDLEVIRKWIELHISANKIDAVIFVDNKSSQYSKEELLDTLSGIQGLDVSYLIDWPHLYGPTGGPNQKWDSDFGQHQVWEWTRRRFLEKARTVTVSDVDELPLTESGAPVGEVALRTESGVFAYPMRSVVPRLIPNAEVRDVRLFSDFNYFQPGSTGSNKYTYVPAKLGDSQQLLVHRVDGTVPETPEPTFARHFIGLHRNWRNGTFDYTAKSLSTGKGSNCIDTALARVLNQNPESLG